MADQLRWFKVWTSLLVDMDHLSDDIIGKWTRLGCRAALVGTNGSVEFDSRSHLAAFLGVKLEGLDMTLRSIPSVVVEEVKNRHGGVSVTFRKWVHYQHDSTRAERARASRSKRRVEERRGDQKRTTPQPPESATTVAELPPPGPKPEPDPRPELPAEDQHAFARTPPVAPPQDPRPPVECRDCYALLRLLSEAMVQFTGPGEMVMSWVHGQHRRFGLERCERAVRWKLETSRGKTRMYLTPQILFKPANFEVTVNAVGERETGSTRPLSL